MRQVRDNVKPSLVGHGSGRSVRGRFDNSDFGP